jgi:hypothetical protein
MREQIALLGPLQHHLPTNLKRVHFFAGMMYCSQLVQRYLIDRCNLLTLYKFQQRDELISFSLKFKFMELIS